MMIRRAILSVSDKNGIVDLARFLAKRGVEILSTGGTARHLADAGIEVIPVSSYTGYPEILGGRVKTLNPRIFGGILFDRDNEAHARDCQEQAIPSIDLVVVNLYPFEDTVAREGVSVPEAIEQIDVGGPSMLRAAAKNFRHVLPLCDPELYPRFMEEEAAGEVSESFRRDAALAVFRRTAAYDEAIASYLESISGSGEAPEKMPQHITLNLSKAQDLRYGENPQQQASFYTPGGEMSFSQVHGKELSYNNLIDLDAAWRIATAFEDPACAVIKHTNPCGAARGDSVDDALRLALEADPVSAFGGIIGLNREFDVDAAQQIAAMFLEVVIAPSFSDEALELLQRKKNLRIVTPGRLEGRFEMRAAAGGYLLQSPDRISPIESWKTVTKIAPSPEQIRALEFAWVLCAHVKSNAIVIARNSQSVGIGAGQMSRVDAAKIAIMKAVLPTVESVAASDAFFPFRDAMDVLIDAGVTAVVQPGGSVRDEEVIAAADEREIAMVFSGERHFRH